MSTGATISAAVLDGFDTRLESQGVDPYDLGLRCGIPERAWDMAGLSVPLTGFVRLLENGSNAGNDPSFGWEMGRRFDLLALGELGEAILKAPTLGAALTTFARYLRLIQDTSELKLAVDDDMAILSYRILDPDIWPRQQDAEFTLSVVHTLIEACLGADWRPFALTFEHGPCRAEQVWNEQIGTHCTFGHDTNSMVIPVAILDAAMPTSERASWCRHADLLGHALIERNRARPMAARVASALLASFGRTPADQRTIARTLGLSCRTMHRRLEAEGTRYSELLADCRLRVAQSSIVQGRKTLSQIAFDLGYSDQSAFCRAFKQSCGVTPSSFQASQRPGA
ncbi:MAG: AraC-like transcriptional regulator QhpR [Hyphomicrobiales bacterium]